MSELLNELLALPVGPRTAPRGKGEGECTRSLELSSTGLTATLTGIPGTIDEGTARRYLIEEGQDPEEWEAIGFRKSEWEQHTASGETKHLESVRFTYRRVGRGLGHEIDSDDIRAILEHHIGEVRRRDSRVSDGNAFLVAIGDLQTGKCDGDGSAGIVQRMFECLDNARDVLLSHHPDGVEHCHIAWLGDHIEGFESQGGANAWRTNLTLTEQLRIVRAAMTYAVRIFAPVCDRLTMAAVPGNHGEAKRFTGNGVTRYDDSFDTDCLLAVQEACFLSDKYDHVEFYVPDRDELTVLLDVNGVRIAHAHGHKWRVGKHFEWWQGQSFNRDSAMHTADVLLAGHTHHFHAEMDGSRLFLQVPALESESTWYRHQKGTQGYPGLVVADVADGTLSNITVVRGSKIDSTD